MLGAQRYSFKQRLKGERRWVFNNVIVHNWPADNFLKLILGHVLEWEAGACLASLSPFCDKINWFCFPLLNILLRKQLCISSNRLYILNQKFCCEKSLLLMNYWIFHETALWKTYSIIQSLSDKTQNVENKI